MLNNLLEFRPLGSRCESHLLIANPCSQTLRVYSGPHLPASSLTLLHQASPLSIYPSFPFLLAPSSYSMLKYLYIVNRRKIFFLNLIHTSSPTSSPSLPTTHFESCLQVLLTSQSSPAWWVLSLPLHWNDSSLTYTLQIQWSFVSSISSLLPQQHVALMTTPSSLNLPFLWLLWLLLMAFLLHLWSVLTALYRLVHFSYTLTDGVLEGWVLDSSIFIPCTLWGVSLLTHF